MAEKIDDRQVHICGFRYFLFFNNEPIGSSAFQASRAEGRGDALACCVLEASLTPTANAVVSVRVPLCGSLAERGAKLLASEATPSNERTFMSEPKVQM